jgi:flagellar hook-basal body complex protein FliE
MSGGASPYMPVSPPAAEKTSQGPSGGFGEALKAYAGSVNDQQQSATVAIGDLVSGSSGDILPAVAALAKADLSFKLLMGVRNKVIEAYKQTMNMQI